MSSYEREGRDSGESAPLLQQQANNAAPSPQPRMVSPTPIPASALSQQQYGTTGSSQGYQIPINQGMPAPPPYDANNPGYFIPHPGHYPPAQHQHQQSPIILHSPNQPSQQVVGAGGAGMPPQPPFYYPFSPQGGGMPQYQYPVYPMQHQQHPSQQQQRQQSRPGQNTNAPNPGVPSHSSTGSGSLPALNDIFVPDGKESQPTGYGSLSTSPKIYNAPIHRLPPSGRPPQQQQQTINRTNSSGEMKRLLNKGGPATKEHRRVHSDNPLRLGRSHNRANSNEYLPPLGGVGHNRSRTLSGGNPMLGKPRHRRGDSSSSYHSMGGGSYGGSIADSSMVSMRSNIAKSSMFGGVDEEGRPILYYPYEAIRLVMIPDPDKKPRKHASRNSSYDELSDEDTAEQEDYLPLTVGHLYADGPVNLDDHYKDYHRLSDQLEQGLTPQWESLDTHPLKRKKKDDSKANQEPEGMCACPCDNCHFCLGKQDLLPPTNYVVAVSDDIYRRIFSEVADAQNMPCGLFFCGHHEDVDHPSVWIPGTLVIILFGTMFALAYYAEDLV